MKKKYLNIFLCLVIYYSNVNSMSRLQAFKNNLSSRYLMANSFLVKPNQRFYSPSISYIAKLKKTIKTIENSNQKLIFAEDQNGNKIPISFGIWKILEIKYYDYHSEKFKKEINLYDKNNKLIRTYYIYPIKYHS